MISSLFPHLCPACLVHFTCMGCEMGGKWLYSCFQDLFTNAGNIYEMFPFSFFSKHSVGVQVVHSYSRTE